MDELEGRIRSLAAAEPGASLRNSSDLLTDFRRRRFRRSMAAVAGISSAAIAVTAFAVIGSGGPPQPRPPVLGAPGCVPPTITIQADGVDAETGLPLVTAPARTPIQLAPSEIGNAPISNLILTIGKPGSDPQVGPSSAPLAGANVVSSIGAVPGRPVSLTGPASAGRYPIVASFNYTNDANECGADPGGGRAAGIIGYVKVA